MRQNHLLVPDRRQMLRNGVLAATALAFSGPENVWAQSSQTLTVASAGSIHALLDGPVKDAAAHDLHLDLQTYSGGADVVARTVVAGARPADVFISVTAGPMRRVIEAGKARIAYPIARTELVILYSAKSRFAPRFADVAAGKRNWWEVLQEPGLKFARSNPEDDPSGRCILFAMMLAAKKYGQPDLVQEVLGPTLNPAQVQPGTNVRAGLENGTIDAAGGYRIATAQGKIPYIALPADLNLGELDVRSRHPDVSFAIGDKIFYPEPLVFYAAALTSALNPGGASRFVKWLQGEQGATLLKANGFESVSGAATINGS